MKAVKKQFIIILIILLFAGCGKKAPVVMPPAKALHIAANTPEVKALLSYRNKALASCLEVKVMRSCDSHWVSCRDNAWVVEYLPTDKCPAKGDGRLGMYFVIDGQTGEIISHYPEAEYFADARFCRDNADCLGGKVGQKQQCLNFIAAPFEHFQSLTPCQCTAGQCIVKE